MNIERFSPDDPRQWLSRARSNFSQAKGGIQLPSVYLEDLCFQAQQAAEKAIKGVLITLKVRFPYTHDLAELLSLIAQTGETIPEQIREAAKLSDYSVQARYPGLAEPVIHEEYLEAINIAEAVINWAEKIIG
jgi:HEPN domain-containing protein